MLRTFSTRAVCEIAPVTTYTLHGTLKTLAMILIYEGLGFITCLPSLLGVDGCAT